MAVVFSLLVPEPVSGKEAREFYKHKAFVSHFEALVIIKALWSKKRKHADEFDP